MLAGNSSCPGASLKNSISSAFPGHDPPTMHLRFKHSIRCDADAAAAAAQYIYAIVDYDAAADHVLNPEISIEGFSSMDTNPQAPALWCLLPAPHESPAAAAAIGISPMLSVDSTTTRAQLQISCKKPATQNRSANSDWHHKAKELACYLLPCVYDREAGHVRFVTPGQKIAVGNDTGEKHALFLTCQKGNCSQWHLQSYVLLGETVHYGQDEHVHSIVG